MVIRPRFCNDKNCPIYKEAKKREYETSTSNAQKFMDNNLSNNPECQACKQQNQHEQYFSIKNYIG